MLRSIDLFAFFVANSLALSSRYPAAADDVPDSLSCHCTSCPTSVCVVDVGGACLHVAETLEDGSIKEYASCLAPDVMIPEGRPLPCQGIRGGPKVVCCFSDFCNAVSPGVSYEPESQIPGWQMVLILVVLLLVKIVCAAVYAYRRSRKISNASSELQLAEESGLTATPITSIIPKVVLLQPVMKSSSAMGYVGSFKRELVFVKAFSLAEKPIWRHETDIYSIGLLRHPNIIRWIASSYRTGGIVTGFWLVTEYAAHGSLTGFLTRYTISVSQVALFLRGIVHGISFLHASFPGSDEKSCKPPIAHCDIKAENILVRADLTCAIGDFGLSVDRRSFDFDSRPLDTLHAGTLRYSAPEKLQKFRIHSFDCLLQRDVYSMALVFWEVIQRCDIHAISGFERAFDNELGAKPSHEQCYSVVVVRQMRPQIPEDWRHNPLIAEFLSLTEECWVQNPGSRHTSLFVRFAIDRLTGNDG